MLTKSQTIWLAAAMLVGLVLRPGGVLTKPDRVEIKDFFGDWVGVSVDQDGSSSGLSITAQDINVAIRRQDDGFRVCWTTVRAQDQGDPIRTQWRFTFEPGPDKRTWKATEAGNTLTTRRGVWANLRGRTLTIFGIITNEDGFSGLQIYDRTLDEFGMRLDFLRTDRDQVLRTVSGQLMRAKDLASPAPAERDRYQAYPGAPEEAAAPAPVEDYCGDA